MNETPQPTPNPNLDERIKKIAAAQADLAAMTPSPDQIAREQILEMHAQNHKTSEDTKAALADAKTAIPAAVATMLKEHRQRMDDIQTASDQRIIAAVVARLSPKFSNGDIIDRIDLWDSIITAVLVLGICVLIVLRH
jgi:hypothetical protein